MTEIEIYSAVLCPFAHRSRLTLIEKGVPFQLIEIDLQDKPANFKEISPYGKVPVLKHGDQRVWESAVINEYLEEAFPKPALLPLQSSIGGIMTFHTDYPQPTSAQEVLRFWFPMSPDCDQSTLVRQWLRWFRGGADTEIMERFVPLLEQAIQGKLDSWASEARSRLALILVLDQFSRTIYRGNAQAFAQDPKARQLALEGLEIGHYAALETPWEKTFFLLPFGHSEDLEKLELAVKLAAELLSEASPDHRELLEFSAEQARRHRDIIARFGRHPHRNEVLRRESTPEELEYLIHGEIVPQRSLPSHLQQLLSSRCDR